MAKLRTTLSGTLLLATLLLAVHSAWVRSQHPETYQLRRGELPGFDPYVYVAMAESPTIFTLPPWGYRILTPVLVHLLPGRTALGFRIVTFGSFVAAAVCLGLLLQRLGHTPAMIVLGVALFTLSPFVGVFLQNPFFVDPAAVALLAALLFAIEAGAGLATLALLTLLGTAAKEVTLALVPFLCWARRDALGRGRVLREAGLVVLPAIAFAIALRIRWPAAVPSPTPQLDAQMLGGLAAVVRRSAGHWLLFGGLMPLALIGLAHASTRAYLRRYGPALAVLFVLPLAYTAFYPILLGHLRAELPRYAVFVLPLLVPVALGAVAWWWPPSPAPGGASAARAPSTKAAAVPWVVMVLLVAAPFFVLDEYRRVVHERDGKRLLALTRQGPQVAAALARGEKVVLDEAGPFLVDGWEAESPEGGGRIWMRGRRASLVVPVLGPQDVGVSLSLSAPAADVTLRATVDGTAVGEARVGRTPATTTLRLPGSALVRGENELTLATETPVTVQLHGVLLEPAS